MNSIYAKQLITTIIMLGSVLLYISNRFYIGLDPQGDGRCLHAQLFIVDKWDTDLEIGDLAVVLSSDLIPGQEVKVTKIVAGLSGNTVSYDNTKVTSDSGFTLKSRVLDAEALVGKKITPATTKLNDDEIFLVGERPLSYDSRFWGAANQSNVIGTAYAIF